MENIIITTEKETPYIPNVNFDAKTGNCVIEGESFMDNTFEFYNPLIEWIIKYTEEIDMALTLKIRLTYFNTSTSRILLELLEVLRDYEESGGAVEVNWFCSEDDPDMRDEIADFESESGLKINVQKF